MGFMVWVWVVGWDGGSCGLMGVGLRVSLGFVSMFMEVWVGVGGEWVEGAVGWSRVDNGGSCGLMGVGLGVSLGFVSMFMEGWVGVGGEWVEGAVGWSRVDNGLFVGVGWCLYEFEALG